MHLFLRILLALVLFFALMIVVPYLLGLVGITIPDQIVRICLGMALLGYIIWGPPMPGVKAP